VRLPPPEVLLAIVRSPAGLIGLVSRRSAEATSRAGGAPSTPPGYEVVRTPVARLAPRHRAAPELTRAWDRLADAVPHGALVLADVLHVLVATVPSAVRAERAPLRLADARPPRRATAAHPRAFKGTRHKPPKPAARARCDLRGDLCVEANTRRLLSALWPERGGAAHHLRGRGLDPAALRRLLSPSAAPLDPYLLFHHDSPSRVPLPAVFVERVLPSLGGAPLSTLRRMAVLHDRLGMDAELAALGARLLRAAGHERGLGWWNVIESQPPERRPTFLALALETGACHEAPAPIDHATWRHLGHDAPADVYERWTQVVLESLAHRRNTTYIATGIRFAAAHARDATFGRVDDAADFDDAAEALIDRVLPPSWTGHDRMALWATCGAIPAFASYLRATPWESFSPTQTERLLRFFMDLRWRGVADGAVSPPLWRAIRSGLPRLETRLREVGDGYVPQFLWDLGEIVDRMDTPKDIEDRLSLAIDLLARLNRPPLSDDGHIAWATSHLLKLPPDQRTRVLNAGDAGFHRLDRACRRENDAFLIACGLGVLVEQAPRLVADSFLTAPGPLFRAARQLGTLSRESRRELLTACRKRPLFADDVERRRLPQLVALMRTEPGATIPRALRAHLEGTRGLTAGQLERHERVLREQIPVLRLAAVQAAVEQRLIASVGVATVRRDALPALALLQWASENKRGLRRFLRRYLIGDTDYLRQHPATRQWARRHPRVDIDLWTHGIERRVPGENGSEVVLRIEDDAIEVLNMGTYVGSCLGLGGSFSHSAAAVLLDVNKQVIYARGPRGEVLARQLVAISDDDRLVCFQVYPQSVSRAMRKAFAAYDTALAAALGIERLEASASYTVDHVLSQDWYDDIAWDHRDEEGRGSKSWTRASK